MTRPVANLCPVILLAAIPLAACATAPPPYATNVRAWPRSGESVDQFQTDDLACRNYMQAQAAANHSAVGTSNAIAGGAQSPSDTAYAQCMTSKGYRVEYVNIFAPPPGNGYGYGYGYAHPNDADVHPGGYSHYVTYLYAVGTLPFFFFVTHHHDGFHHEDFHSRGFPS